MADLSGRKLGNYTLGERIGRGGMADVYRARQESMDRDVAVKVMSEALAANDEFLARFEREARVIARLQHPHILPVIDFGRSGDYVYLVMRLIDGGSLAERLQAGPFTLRQVERTLGQVASALHYAHQRGVIHRDLKPNNILLDEEDNTYLTDFGIAKMLAATTGARSLTATGHVMGTPAYMAPEQWRSEPVDARTDIYALGVILFEMLMGNLPFQAETPFAMMYKHFDTPPPLPRVINPDLPDQIEIILTRALAKQPAQRYPSADVLSEHFSQALRGLPPEQLQHELPRATVEQIEAATPSSSLAAPHYEPTAPIGLLPAHRASTPPSLTPLDTPTELVDSRGGLPRQDSGARPTAPRRRNRWRWLGGGALAAIAAAVAIALLVRGGLDGGTEDRDTPTVIAQGSPTATADQPPTTAPNLEATADHMAMLRLTALALTGTASAEKITPSPTITAAPTQIAAAATHTSTPTATHTATATVTATDTATATHTVTPTATDTPDVQATTSALISEHQTATAQRWTATPTPDIEQTVIAAFTQTAAAWTATSTATRTPSPTRTPPPAITALPIRTAPATSIPTPTRWPTPLALATVRPTTSRTCALPIRMKVNEGGRVTLVPPESSRARALPGIGEAVLREVPPGATFWVVAGPACVNAIQWWQVQAVIPNEGTTWTGWLAEGRDDEYWIEPFETGPATCTGAPIPRMTPGERGRITLEPPQASRIRSQPTTDNTVGLIIGRLEPGQEFTVISGPVCDPVNRWHWWLVQTDQIEGWVAEGPVGQYYIEPL